MLRLVHLLIIALYLVLPAAALGSALLRRRPRGPDAPGGLGGVIVTFFAGLVIGGVLVLIYARVLHGPVPFGQVLLAGYFATGMLLLLRTADVVLLWLLRTLLGLRRPGALTPLRVIRVGGMYLVRTVALLAVGMPFVLAVATVYRPKIVPRDDPQVRYDYDFEPVAFSASDNVRLAGWWIPAAHAPRATPAPLKASWGRRTVILCHGLYASKSHQLVLAQRLVPAGFNVFAFDFRAHGQSGGQITGLGAIERGDVLAAVRWVQQQHPAESLKIFGLGASTGAGALIAAAADESPEGQSIAAIALFGAFDDLGKLTDEFSQTHFERPLSWLLRHVGLPLASAHAGEDLAAFAPAKLIARVWPRPVLLIHSQHDELIPFERGRALLEAASQPRYHIWFPRGTHHDIVQDPAAAEVVLEFFRQARALPVI